MSGGGKKGELLTIWWQMVVENWDTCTKIKVKILLS